MEGVELNKDRVSQDTIAEQPWQCFAYLYLAAPFIADELCISHT